MADDIFARTMQACLESKKTASANSNATKKTVKKITESKTATKKATKKVSEVAPKKKATTKFYENKGSRLFEEDDFDAEQAELDAYEADSEDENGIVDDVADDIIVVVDPELDADEISDTAAEAQDIIDNTEEGEVPTTDEYVGDFTYTCPICGNTFFSSEELGEGDACPVCGDTPDGFVLVGEVAESDTAADEDIAADEDEIIDDEEEIADDAEDLELDMPEDEEVEEGCKKRESLRAPIRKTSVRKESARKPVSRRRPALNLDESTFNPYLTKFIRENYKNTRSLTVKKASLKNGKLTLECALLFKSGKSKRVVLKAEGFKRSGASILNVRDDGTFKAESKKIAPIKMRVNTAKNVVKCEGMKYDFTTVCEGRRARVTSTPIVENKKIPAQRKTAPARKAAPRRRVSK